MLEQTIRLVTSEINPDGITLRFGPLGNKSHQKKILKDIEDKTKEDFTTGANPDIKLHPNEVREYFYNQAFPTLDDMNNLGWKLESFALIYDTNLDRMQIAIFSREV